MKNKVTALFRWEVIRFPGGGAVREKRTGKWTLAILNFNGQEIDLNGAEVELHENGIEFF